ncbi:hypothetical protein D083_1341 [Dickeya solani RNS 08.23.3.1.A]|nr:hypothetical protein D083_1341 [Dickeya solani RNS 08.23.3.1.A]
MKGLPDRHFDDSWYDYFIFIYISVCYLFLLMVGTVGA